jgi:hypothetical protein
MQHYVTYKNSAALKGFSGYSFSSFLEVVLYVNNA